MDKITIERLKLFAYHGCDRAENKDGQNFYITVELELDLHQTMQTDNLDATVDYSQICHLIKQVFCQEKYKTLEKCCGVLMEALFEYSTLIESIYIKIDKPNAPIALDFASVSVAVKRKKTRVYLGLGSNLFEKQKNIDKAIEKIGSIAKIKKIATPIVSKPWGIVQDQPDFVNTVVGIETTMEPMQLLAHIKKIEESLGRKETRKWGERIIDIDILLYDDLLFCNESLVIPHPYMHIRDFVLTPLQEIAPFVVHPLYKKTIFELAKDCKESLL